jgi:hypothetical protein
MLIKKYGLSIILLICGSIAIAAFLTHSQRAATVNPKREGAMRTENNSTERYMNFTNLTLAEKKRYFEEAAAEEKSVLWRVHLALSLTEHPDLSIEQQQVIADAISFAAPSLFEIFEMKTEDVTKRIEKEKALDRFRERISGLFRKDEASAIFRSLGKPQAAQYTTAGQTCTCSDAGDCDQPNCCCLSESGGCDPTSSGCGFLWLFSCNGKCTGPYPQSVNRETAKT